MLEVQKRRAAESLKGCPLCGAINAAENPECFVCRWSGGFEHDPDVIQEGLERLMRRCPELAQAILDSPRRPRGIRGLWQNLCRAVRRRFWRARLDVRA